MHDVNGFSDAGYSPSAIVPDGQITGPRYELHAIKVATSMTFAFALIVCDVPPMRAGLVASLGLMAGIIVWQRALFRANPTAFLLDKLCDTALACVSLAAYVKLAAGWFPALCVLGACVAVYGCTRTKADP